LVEESFIPAGFNQTAIGEGVYATYDETAWIGESTLSYNDEIGDHTINALLGHTLQESISNFSDLTGQGYASNNNPPVSTAATTVGTSSFTSFGFQSFFSRLNYAYKSKYLVSLSLRADGSSRFGKNNRYGVFPAVSLGWRVSEEGFMDFAKTVVSNLKFRASYGVTGNAEIGNFTYRNGYALSASYNNTPGIAPSSLGNPNLTWEQTAQLNLGIDLGLFDDRVNIVADYFVKNTTDILLGRDIPGTLGFTSITDNFGEIENRGVELGINADVIKLENGFTWNTNFNYTHVKNEVVNVLNNGQIISRNFVILEGEELSQLNLIRFLGVDPLTGDAKFEDLNGDGLINLADRQAVGSGLPTDFAGWTNRFSYKGFSLEVFFQYSGGNKIFNQSRFAYENYGSLQDGIPFGNQSVRSLNYWRQPGDITDIPRPSLVTANDTDAQYQRFSTQYLEDGDFLRLKNVMLAYNFPSSVTDKLKLASLRIYAQGRNLVTWTNYTGFDPEVSTNTASQGDLNAQQGEDFGTLGQARTFTFGINIGL
ncbi:MAG: SusC/RagA family TonB-linked outer membrane protein, partial [Flammeovirgaceae bacterium]